MDKEKIIALISDLQNTVDQLVSRIDKLERELDDYRFNNNCPSVSSYTVYPMSLANEPDNYARPIENDYYSINEFDFAGMRLSALNSYDLERFIADVGRLKKSIQSLGDIETLKENIYHMAEEVDKMQKDMMNLIWKEAGKAMNKIQDLASRTDSAKIDNKELLLDKDE